MARGLGQDAGDRAEEREEMIRLNDGLLKLLIVADQHDDLDLHGINLPPYPDDLIVDIDPINPLFILKRANF